MGIKIMIKSMIKSRSRIKIKKTAGRAEYG